MAIASLIYGKNCVGDYFHIDGNNFFPVLHQLVTSELDCDRMDYLLRDSYFCGVSYGHFDLDWTIDNLDLSLYDGQFFLGINERSISTFDDFLLSRYHMFLMVYFHYKSVCLEQMLIKIFKNDLNYKIPSNIEEYLEHDDYYLQKVMLRENSDLIKRFLSGSIPDKVFESFTEDQHQLIKPLEIFLKENHIDYIKCESKNRVSKYYSLESKKTAYPIKVVRKNRYSGTMTTKNINEVTSLYEKYQETHMVNRVHLDLHRLKPEYKKKIFEIIKGQH